MTVFDADVIKASRAKSASARVNDRSSTATPSARAQSASVARVTPPRMRLSSCRVTSTPACVTIQALLDAPSVILPAASVNQASLAPSRLAASLARHAGYSITVLISERPQRISGIVLTAIPVSASAAIFAWLCDRAITTSVGATFPIDGNAKSRGPSPRVTCR